MARGFFKLLILVVSMVSCIKGIQDEIFDQASINRGLELGSDRLTPELLWKFGRVGDLKLSPDKKKALYTVTDYNIEENRSYRDVYMLNIGSEEVERITSSREKESSINWRPDGEAITYISAASGVPQLWEMALDGTKKEQITSEKEGVSGYGYAPTMDKLFIVKRVKLDKDIHDLYPDLPHANARIENDLMYRHWNDWHDYKYNHIFIGDYKSGSVSNFKDIMDKQRYDSPMLPFGGVEQLAWSTDGKQLAYTTKAKTGKEYSESTNSDIFIYDTESGALDNLTSGMMGYDMNPIFSSDGVFLAWESMERDGYESDRSRIFVKNLSTGAKSDRTAQSELTYGGISWAADNKSVYAIADIKATDEIFNVSVNDTADHENEIIECADDERALIGNPNIKRLTNGKHNYKQVLDAGEKLVGLKMSMSQPAEVVVVDKNSGEAKNVSQINASLLSQLKMGDVKERIVKTTDGKDMQVWVVYPPDFDPNKKYPALLYCQGGPQGTISQNWSYRWNFQLMAANGYIVVAPNRRGLPGFGMEWLEQISKDYGGQNIKDYISAIDDVAKEDYVDENRLGAVGASYGGYSVFYLAGQYPDKFKALISHCGMFNFEQMYATTEEMWFPNWDLGGAYWDKDNDVAQRSYDASPHKFVQNWKAPILVIHGDKDFRIPYTQGMGAFNSAVMQGIPAKFLYFPDECHWVLEPQNGILWHRVFFDWLDEWLK
ncbi:MAG: alpha/beta fold hydrolase [Bacteroidales bacterium]